MWPTDEQKRIEAQIEVQPLPAQKAYGFIQAELYCVNVLSIPTEP